MTEVIGMINWIASLFKINSKIYTLRLKTMSGIEFNMVYQLVKYRSSLELAQTLCLLYSIWNDGGWELTQSAPSVVTPQATVPHDLVITTARPDMVYINGNPVTLVELTIPANLPDHLRSAQSRKSQKPHCWVIWYKSFLNHNRNWISRKLVIVK